MSAPHQPTVPLLPAAPEGQNTFRGSGVRARLILLVVVAVVLFSFGAGQVLIQIQRGALFDEARQRAAALLETLAVPCALALSLNDLEMLDGYLEELSMGGGRHLGLVQAAMLDPEGRIIALSGRGNLQTAKNEPAVQHGEGFQQRANQADRPLWWQHTSSDGTTLLDVSMPTVSGLRWGTLVATFDLRHVDERLAHTKQLVLLSAALIAAALMLLLYIGVSRLVLQPISALGLAARSIRTGDFTTRVILKDRDEFGQLAETFNAMAEELESYTSNLEKRVAERTAEVETKNQQLEAVNRQLEVAVDELDRLARTDALTGMFNRRAFEERLNFEVRRSQRSQYALSLLIVDLDLFKSVNDTYGHPSGDLVLQRLSTLLESNLRTTDLLARLGGEEFAILLIDTASDAAMIVAEKLRKAVEETRFEDVQGGQIAGVTISAGLASFPTHAEDVDTLCQRADSALYVAKNNGRNRVDIWQPDLPAAANGPTSG